MYSGESESQGGALEGTRDLFEMLLESSVVVQLRWSCALQIA